MEQGICCKGIWRREFCCGHKYGYLFGVWIASQIQRGQRFRFSEDSTRTRWDIVSTEESRYFGNRPLSNAFHRARGRWHFGVAKRRPQWSPQNRPTVVRAKPANGRGRGLSCSTLQPPVEASLFSYANSADRI